MSAMTKRENLLSLLNRRGFEKVPVRYPMCPSLEQKFREYVSAHPVDFDLEQPFAEVSHIPQKPVERSVYNKYYDGQELAPGTKIDFMGVAHEPGSAAAFHMTKMYHPMENFTSVEQIEAYEWPDYTDADRTVQAAEVKKAREDNMVSLGCMPWTLWEAAWYIRGMENLMMDMMTDDPMAYALMDRITDRVEAAMVAYAKSGTDAILLGDDIGMQHSIMMSTDLYCEWIKPRLTRVIRAAKAIKPDLIFIYHSCGFIKPFIPHLIEAGIDVLNPIQPESMDFREIFDLYGGQISFLGTLGTQTTMPFGTPDDVRRTVFENLDIAGDYGGLFPAPTHLLEPEVPVENVLAYLKACSDYR